MTNLKISSPKSEPSDATMDEFVVVDDSERELPHHPKEQAKHDVDLEIHPLSSDEGVLISVKPPKTPAEKIPHVPVDIVLVIDVSGSMHWSAPLPDTQDHEEKESAGLSVLDLTKHAARTILAPLNENDRLALVTFSADARIVQELTFMNKKGKNDISAKIESLVHEGSTNLWSGIKTGLSVFENASINNNVQGMFVLTDGMPNHMCPPQGYVTKLKPMLASMAASRPQVPSIHTFGFGYDMRSDLMQSIAEVGNGNYAFIPDAGMIGTIFVHAMANLCSTFCTDAELEIQTSNSVMLQCPTVFNIERPDLNTLILSLGSLQYGQSRDVVITSKKAGKRPIIVRATLEYKNRMSDQSTKISATLNKVSARLPQAVSDYHVFRSQLCAFLAAFFPIQANGEHSALSDDKNSFNFEHARSQMDSLVMRIEASARLDDVNIQSILSELAGDEPAGQIAKAVSTKGKVNFYQRWGRHYLPSLLHAHARQVCNSFKDPGPLRYGVDSPLFVKCRDEMDTAFENLPPPKPTRPPTRKADGTYVAHKHVSSMARYHRSSNPCFEAQSEVRMGDDSSLAVKNLAPGMEVWTPHRVRKVVAVVRTAPRPNGKDELCRIGDLWVTPYHPIHLNGSWVFPADVADESKGCQSNVYSVLLAYSNNSDAHSIQIGGQRCTTLGHGVRQGDSDARAHAFFGSHVKVVRSLRKLPKDKNGQLVSAGVSRHPNTGLVCGFNASVPKAGVVRARTQKCAVGRAKHSARYSFRARTAVALRA